MEHRLELRDKLIEILADSGVHGAADRVHFQPPEGTQLKYPCIIYKQIGDRTTHANDSLYTRTKRYEITAITRDADSPLQDMIAELRYCGLDRIFTSDNLYHFVFTIYH